jgi:hypothetical protein
VWSADSGYNTGHIAVTSGPISDTADDRLFQTQRWDDASGQELNYSFNVPDGDYIVNLYFAEACSALSYPSARVFDVSLEGYTVDHNLDIYREVGKNTAHMRSYDVTIIDGQLNIKFLHGIENPSISAIEILSATSSTPSAPTNTSDFTLRVNSGGGKYTDRDGNVWSADSGYNTGHIAVTSGSISDTADDPLFQTQRWDDASGQELTYSFNVPDGDYEVNLYFAETYSGVFYPNGRVFDVSLEGYIVDHNLDIYREAGKNTAHMRSYLVTVVDGQLNIKFLHGIENPSISAIEILNY